MESFSAEGAEEAENHTGMGPCRSWAEQQSDIAAFLKPRLVQSDFKPRLLLAQFDTDSITVYQAYKPSIGLQVAATGNFESCSEFSFSRMTWIKPNFSWMMYRSGWASKKNQDTILAIRLRRSYFEDLLGQAVPTSWDDATYGSEKEWKKALRKADVIVQWDPDHHLVSGAKLRYRVLQLGIRRQALGGFKGPGILSIANVTSHVHVIRNELFGIPAGGKGSRDAKTPLEQHYPVPEASRETHRIS